MSLNMPPESKEAELAALKAKLNECVQKYSTTKFEGEDIVELITEGESIDWIVDQLKKDSAKVDLDEITPLLTDLKKLIAPEKAIPEAEPAPESMIESPTPELSQVDTSQLDLSQIGKMLPPGMTLPPGFDINQIQRMIESPQGKIMEDFLIFCREKGIDLNEGSLNNSHTQRLQKEWQSTPREAFDGKTPAEMLARAQGKGETFRRDERRVGRNDPCPCGSGKKYKKCCG
jgi:hypothetical protein